jgi:hypothetical protein
MITGSSRLVWKTETTFKQESFEHTTSQGGNHSKPESRLIGGNVLLHNIDTIVRIDPLQLDEYFRLDVERTPVTPPPSGVIVRISHKGIRSIK